MEQPYLQQVSVQAVHDFLLQHNKLFSVVPELMDILMTGEDHSQANQPNSLAEGPLILICKSCFTAEAVLAGPYVLGSSKQHRLVATFVKAHLSPLIKKLMCEYAILVSAFSCTNETVFPCSELFVLKNEG
eukprot:1144136-Pelagomonas_calceolata.AAC.2